GNGNCWKSFYEKFLSRSAYKKGYSISVLQPECFFLYSILRDMEGFVMLFLLGL
ncbi:hypothetical protein HMPREF1981_01741, partial [Bacteroides pyogenes F0041]